MILEKTIIYKKKIEKSIINLIFALLLLIKRIQIYDIQIVFDYNLDYLFILF